MNKKFAQILDTFAEKIGYVRRGPMGVPRMIEINLAVPLADWPYDIAGNIFYIWSAPDRDDYVNIKINQTSQPAIPYRMGQGLKTPFDRLLITTPAGQTGTMHLIFGTEAPELLEIIDNRAALSGNISDMLAELRGDTTYENFIGITITAAPGATTIMAALATRKGAIIQALSTNTGNVFLGFANTVTVGGAPGVWFTELQPGQAFTIDDYRGPIYGIATAAQVVGTGEW